MMAIALDLDLTAEDVSRLTSADALAAFFQRMGYSAGKRAVIPAQAVGLDGLSDIRHIELLSEDAEGFLRVVFVQLRAVTAKARNTLVRTFGQQNQDYLLVLTSDFEALEFVLIEKVRHQRKGPGGDCITKPQAKVFVVPRRWPQNMLRIVRRLTFTARDEGGQPDAILQYGKLVSVFDAAHYGGEYFQNRALFADHYLRTRLPEDPAWKQPANEAFAAVSALMRQARDRLGDKDEAAARQQLYEPLFKSLGFTTKTDKKSTDATPQPDYRLASSSGEPRTVALVYAWERWLDGPDAADADKPNENPGAAVVTLLERGDADWVIVSNGKLWRLYSRQAHSRSTNFYEVDLEDALLATGQTDPNEAFRYWWLFFRESAFAPVADKKACWLDAVAAGSRDYAREVEDELKRRVFYEVVPQLAGGFLADRRLRLNHRSTPSDAELEEIREATLTLLYRILFLLYAECRDLLPVRESAYYQISIKKLKEEIAEAAGIAETQADEKLAAVYKRSSTTLYDRLGELFAVMDGGDLKRNRACNVPVYNGGLFRVEPEEDAADEREARVARFLLAHKVPDAFLASALDRLARVPDPKGIPAFGLAFVDYKSLFVRQLGSIYEGLLEFRLKIADEDLPPVTDKGRRKSTRLSASRGAKDCAGVKKGEPYLANDRAERKATGSYYTPDTIVQYIVEHTVGSVLNRKLEALRPAFREAEKTYHRHLGDIQAGAATPARSKYEREHRVTAPDQQRALAANLAYDKHKNLVERLFDLKVLDLAMGSGHFLVEAVDFITDEVLHFLNAFPSNPVTAAMARTRASILESLTEQGIETDALLEKQLTDVHLIKRHVLKRCIYGVDRNPLATELAKVSLWLDAFTIGAPLSFLDHHVRVGNSLIGATVQEAQDALHTDQMKLFGSRFAGLKLAAIGMAAIAAMPDATAGQVKLSQREYHRASDALAPFKRILDAYLMQWFMPDDVVEQANKPRRSLDRKQEIHRSKREWRLPAQIVADFLEAAESKPFFEATTHEQASEIAKGLPEPDRAIAEAVLHTARERRFFHWELEFPECFYEPREGTKQVIEPRENPGFDAVIGNPPYVRVELVGASEKSYLKARYSAIVDRCDIYVGFIQRELMLLGQTGFVGLIVSSQFCNTDYGHSLREVLARGRSVAELMDLAPLQVFQDALTYPAILVLSSRPQPTVKVLSMATVLPPTLPDLPHEALFAAYRDRHAVLRSEQLYEMRTWNAESLCSGDTVLSAFGSAATTLGAICNISSSMKSGLDDVLIGRLVERGPSWLVLQPPAAQKPIRVRSSLWRPVIRPRDLPEDGSAIREPSRYVFWPYREVAHDKFEFMTEPECQSACADTWDYLCSHRAELLGRRDSRKTWEEHGRSWYSLGRIGKPSDYLPPKLLSPGEFAEPRFCVSRDSSLFPCARIIGISSIRVPWDSLLVFLGTRFTRSWLRANLPPKGGGFRGMSVGDLARLPVPVPGDEIWPTLASADSIAATRMVEAWLARCSLP